MDSSLKKGIEKIVNRFSKDVFDIIKRYNEKLYMEATNMYDAFLDQYYSQYSPLYYVRHMDRQNDWSMGLYFGQNITKTDYSLTIEFLGTDMPQDYQHDSAYDVLQNVMSGFRGIPKYWLKTWSGEYNGSIFSYVGTMRDAFQLYEDNLLHLMRTELEKELKRRGW